MHSDRAVYLDGSCQFVEARDDSLDLEVVALDLAGDQHAGVVELTFDRDSQALGKDRLDLGVGCIDHGPVAQHEVVDTVEFDDVSRDLDLGLRLGVVEVIVLGLDLRDNDRTVRLELAVDLDQQACPLNGIVAQVRNLHIVGQGPGNGSSTHGKLDVTAADRRDDTVELDFRRVAAELVFEGEIGRLNDAVFVDQTADFDEVALGQRVEIDALENCQVLADLDLHAEDIEGFGRSVRSHHWHRADRPLDLGIVDQLVSSTARPVFGDRAPDPHLHADLEAFLATYAVEGPVDVDEGTVSVEPDAVHENTAEALDGSGTDIRNFASRRIRKARRIAPASAAGKDQRYDAARQQSSAQIGSHCVDSPLVRSARSPHH